MLNTARCDVRGAGPRPRSRAAARQRPDAELQIDVPEVLLDSVDADGQRLGDLLARQAVGDHPPDASSVGVSASRATGGSVVQPLELVGLGVARVAQDDGLGVTCEPFLAGSRGGGA